jgi:nitrogen regulatory protein PII
LEERTITYLTDACLITCILQKDLAEGVLEAAKNCGAQGATISYAIGTGVRERMGLLGMAIDEQKEVIRIIVSKEQSELIFETMYLAGQLDKPGKGIMFMSNLDRVATFIPDEVMNKFA